MDDTYRATHFQASSPLGRMLLDHRDAGTDLFDISALRMELERLPCHPVDIIPALLLKPRLASPVLSDAVVL